MVPAETSTEPFDVAIDLRSPHALSVQSVVEYLKGDIAGGLSINRVAELRATCGPNELAQAPTRPAWQRFLDQFRDLVIWILIIAALVSGVLSDWLDSLAILAIVVLNAVLGFVQEEKAERALAELRKLSDPVVKVIRAGSLQSIPAQDLVPGDLVELEAGDRIPADTRLVRAFGFRTQEAALTGESAPIEKDALTILPVTAPLAERCNMAFMGTLASAGKATTIVVSTGMKTELGRIAELLEVVEHEPTPLQRRLTELGRILMIACLAVMAVIFGLQMLRGQDLLKVFVFSVSLGVAAVPEGLPAVVTTALAIGLRRMVKRHVLIRKLHSVETLGSVTVICSDKTGTLTRNEMTVDEIVVGHDRFRVTGVGYIPSGEFLQGADGAGSDSFSAGSGKERYKAVRIDPRQHPDLIHAMTIGAWCNHAYLQHEDGQWRVTGDPTEGALLVAARKAGIDACSHDSVIHELPFDSERKRMSVVVRQHGDVVMHAKGALETLLPQCCSELRRGLIERLTDGRRRQIIEIGNEMASRALRVLALAYRELPDAAEHAEKDLVFAGLVGMIDPPREEVKRAVRTCAQAGIRPVMITGDHPATALAIARELHIASAEDIALTGQELDAIPEAELSLVSERTAVYARVSAEHKMKIVRALKARHDVVAMTGDGVNDAPAVKAADIGIAMGITGTDVTKEASDMVLMDDNFASIVSAVEEGRCIYDNIQKVLLFLLSCNLGEVLFIFITSLLGWPMPLLAIQLLWINLITDGLPAVALAVEPPEPDIMSRPPRPAHESVLSPKIAIAIAWQGILAAGAGLLAFGFAYWADPNDVPRARTIAFYTLVLEELLRAIAARSPTRTLWQLGVLTNTALLGAIAFSVLLQLGLITLPFTRVAFQIVPLAVFDWLVIAALALMPVTIIEFRKQFVMWRSDKDRHGS